MGLPGAGGTLRPGSLGYNTATLRGQVARGPVPDHPTGSSAANEDSGVIWWGHGNQAYLAMSDDSVLSGPFSWGSDRSKSISEAACPPLGRSVLAGEHAARAPADGKTRPGEQ